MTTAYLQGRVSRWPSRSEASIFLPAIPRRLTAQTAKVMKGLKTAGDACETGNALAFSMAQVTALAEAVMLNQALERVGATPSP